jgi:uncharacterized protein YdhG (YjbR/CyaY superfamily)
MNKKKVYKTINEYIEDQFKETKKALYEVKECILSAAPDAQELFNYNIPAFALVKNGKRDQQIMISGYSKHVGFYPNPEIIEYFADELKGFKQGKGSVQFPNNQPIPRDLIIRMVKKRKEMIKLKKLKNTNGKI